MVRVSVKIHTLGLHRPATESGGPIPAFGGAGIISKVQDDSSGFSTGDPVIFVLETPLVVSKDTDEITVPLQNICRKPNILSSIQAAVIPHAYATAKYALEQINPHLPTKSPDPILVLGSHTLLGASIIQIARNKPPSCMLLATCTSEVNDAIEAVALGANYSIEAAAPDLMAHLRSASAADRLRRNPKDYTTKTANGDDEGVEVILDTDNVLSNQPEVLDLLVGPKILVDFCGQDIEPSRLLGIKYISVGDDVLKEADLVGLQELLDRGRCVLPRGLEIRVTSGLESIGSSGDNGECVKEVLDVTSSYESA